MLCTSDDALHTFSKKYTLKTAWGTSAQMTFRRVIFYFLMHIKRGYLKSSSLIPKHFLQIILRSRNLQLCFLWLSVTHCAPEACSGKTHCWCISRWPPFAQQYCHIQSSFELQGKECWWTKLSDPWQKKTKPRPGDFKLAKGLQFVFPSEIGILTY